MVLTGENQAMFSSLRNSSSKSVLLSCMKPDRAVSRTEGTF